MGAEDTIKDSLNTADPNRSDAAFREIGLGDLVAALIAAMTPTEAGVTVTSNVATLAAQPTNLWQVDVETVGGGGHTGIKKLLKGPITGAAAVVPATGECVWDGGLKVLFATVDKASTADFTYSIGTEAVSVLERSIGEVDTK